jgi:undecaprenyl-diphosphatase
MTETLNMIILGILQGFTEFLPVSSSGHLELGKVILQDDRFGSASESLRVTVALHVATALSTLVVFRNDIVQILKGLLQFKLNEEFLFSCKIVLSMIPAVIVGLTMKDHLEQLFNRNVLLVGFMLIITGLLLLLADRAKTTAQSVGWLDAFVIGIAQMVAMLPGISRSGATISTCVLLGIDREQAARFSFLMVVPLILGYVLKSLVSATDRAELLQADWGPLMAGFVAAFVSGWIACRWMIELVKKAKLTYFSIYCMVVGVISIALGLFGKY